MAARYFPKERIARFVREIALRVYYMTETKTRQKYPNRVKSANYCKKFYWRGLYLIGGIWILYVSIIEGLEFVYWMNVVFTWDNMLILTVSLIWIFVYFKNEEYLCVRTYRNDKKKKNDQTLTVPQKQWRIYFKNSSSIQSFIR